MAEQISLEGLSLLAFSSARNAVESPAVQDPLVFSMILQLCVKNTAYEGENFFSFQGYLSEEMTVSSSLGLVVLNKFLEAWK